jgi:AraC family transcriptional regulator
LNLLEGMNKALDYIENNLDGEIDYTLLAQAACCSQYHFQRFFASVTDIPLSEYIRRRRLTQAALELQHTETKVIDIAMKYGYGSSDAFARAFQAMHGIPPSRARTKGIVLKAYPRITFTLSIKGVYAMKYRIEEKEAFRVIGVKERFTTEGNYQLEEIPKFWGAVAKNGVEDAICGLMDGEPYGLLGICGDMDDKGFDYWIAAPSTKECPVNLSEMTVPAATWAIFEVIGAMPKAIQESWGRIFSEWFPTSGYERPQHGSLPEIEWYGMGDTDSATYRSEIWIPVVKK